MISPPGKSNSSRAFLEYVQGIYVTGIRSLVIPFWQNWVVWPKFGVLGLVVFAQGIPFQKITLIGVRYAEKNMN